MPSAKGTIFTPGFIILCSCNFLFFISFYMLIPILPIYLLDVLQAGNTVTGILLAAYVLAALLIRPVAGFIVDSYSRRVVFVLCSFFYMANFAGYLFIDALVLFGFLRAVHGMAFGMVNTSTMTVVVDIIPPARLGAGIGVFGVAIAVTMAFGPMLGLMLYERTSPTVVFWIALGIAGTGALLGLTVPSTQVPKARVTGTVDTRPLMEKIFLKNAGPSAMTLLSVGFVYGLILNYVTVFARERGVSISVGYFFSLMALGIIISRLFAGKIIDEGGIVKVIVAGKLVTFLSLLLMVLVPGQLSFFLSATIFGVGTGALMPAYQTLFLKIADPLWRGTANSSFFIAWDGGIGIALFSGGFIAEHSSFAALFLFGAGLLLAATVIFVRKVGPTFEKRIHPSHR